MFPISQSFKSAIHLEKFWGVLGILKPSRLPPPLSPLFAGPGEAVAILHFTLSLPGKP